jgi:hypothetical protein
MSGGLTSAPGTSGARDDRRGLFFLRKSGRFSAQSGLRVRFAGKALVAIDPESSMVVVLACSPESGTEIARI